MNENKKQDPIFTEADKFRSYFSEDEAELQELLEKLAKLQAISDEQINNISSAAPGRGTQHYLIEHITNAISIQNQYQSVLKDKRQIKEKALDIAIKNMNGEDIGDGSEILASLQRMIKEQKQNVEKLETVQIQQKTDEELDAEIDKKLEDLD